MTSTTLTPIATAPTTKQKVGIGIAGFYSLTNIASVFFPTPEGETGPPLAILVIGSLLGVLGVVASVLAWRGNRLALRIAAGAVIIVTLTGLPAFFVDVPMGIKALVGFSVLLTVVSIVLMFSAARRSETVVD